MHFTRTARALLVATTLLLLSCGSPETTPLASRTEPVPADTHEATPDCGKTNIASDEYGTEIHPMSGPPGTEVTFSGTTLRGEDWRWAPADRLEAWWNTEVPASEVPGGRAIRKGSVSKLVEVDDMERCRFETSFTVPDAEPGRYKISVFVWHDDGYGYFLPHHFTVTSDSGECPRVGEGGYAIELSVHSGPPGSVVTSSGATPVYAEDGSYVGPSGEIQLWWNADPDYWHEALPGREVVAKNPSGDVVLLGAVQLTACTFDFEFEVPDVPAGDYPILPLAVGFKDSGAWDSATFHAAHAPVFHVRD